MTAELNLKLAQQRAAERHRAATQTRLASEQHTRVTGFTLRGHHLAKLDRFLGQAQRAAHVAEREFEGVSIEVRPHGVVMVHAVGMTSIRL
jgi:hypothetical protein